MFEKIKSFMQENKIKIIVNSTLAIVESLAIVGVDAILGIGMLNIPMSIVVGATIHGKMAQKIEDHFNKVK